MVINARYELLEQHALGGMAFIFRALDQTTQQIVAVKTLRSDYFGNSVYLEMLQEEARIGAALNSPHIIRLLDSGQTADGLFYLVLEWVDGVNLRDWLLAYRHAHRPTPWLLVTSIVSDALAGLTVAHRHAKDGKASPIIHRDISPENILLTDDGRVKLLDFGVARAGDRARSHSTAPGIVKGKLSYFAPEIVGGAPSSIQSDLFAMGVVLWEALAGRKLHEGEQAEVFRQVAQGVIHPLRELRPDLPPQVHEVVDRALLASPTERYQTAQSMRLDLTAAIRIGPFGGSDRSAVAASVREVRAAFAAAASH